MISLTKFALITNTVGEDPTELRLLRTLYLEKPQ